MLNILQIGTIIYKDKDYKILKTKQIYIKQELVKQDLLKNLKGVFEMQKDFEEYNSFCKNHNLKACKPESLKIFLNTKKMSNK